MLGILDYFRRCCLGERAQGIVEYALILAFVVAIAVYLILNTGQNIDIRFEVYRIFDDIIIFIRSL